MSISTFALCVSFISTLFLVGCSTPSRDAVAKEYQRLAALPPVTVNHCPEDKALDSLAVSVSELYNFSHKFMIDYVSKTENNRAYIAFQNDVEYYVKEKKLDPQAAVDFVAAQIQKADESIQDPKEKKWPQVIEGLNAVNAMNPIQKLKEAAPVLASLTKCISQIKELKNSFKGFDAATFAKIKCAGKIGSQASDAMACLLFTMEQYRRTQKAKNYAK